MPAAYWHRTYVLDGGLMAYGEDERDVPRRLAIYVDKILRGARPADLPIELPTKAIGLTILPSLLLRAEEVIE